MLYDVCCMLYAVCCMLYAVGIIFGAAGIHFGSLRHHFLLPRALIGRPEAKRAVQSVVEFVTRSVLWSDS